VPTFAERGCHVVSVTDPYAVISVFLARYIIVDVINIWWQAPKTPEINTIAT
jgi:hypothetical protein